MSRGRSSAVALSLVAAMSLAGCALEAAPVDEQVAAESREVTDVESVAPAAPQESARSQAPASRKTPAASAAPPRRTAAPALLFAASGGDGDSWKDRQGREYRLGMVNAPEVGECYGREATRARKSLVSSGFRARVYTTDDFGRGVSVITTAKGVNVNVALARKGFADDRYLEQFRGENPALARQLDAAFAAAKRERAGLWGACSSGPSEPPAPQPIAAPASSCHPDYKTCVAVKGDGSGSGAANDLDCGDIRKLVLIKQIGVDPYRLDGDDDDGRGCESYA